MQQKTAVAQVYDAQGNGRQVGKDFRPAAIDQAKLKGRSVGIYGPITVREPKVGSEWLTKAVEAFKTLREPIPAESATTAAAEPPDVDDEPPF